MSALGSVVDQTARRGATAEAEATRLLYERYADRIFAFCRHRLGTREEAEDAVQTTFLHAFRGLSRGVVPEFEAAWLFTIARNVCLERHRAAGRRGRVELVRDPEALEDGRSAPARQGEHLIGLDEALARMPETQRRAILLREWQGLSYREIAADLGLSQAAVETLIFRARRSLAAKLNGERDARTGHGVGAGAVFTALKGLGGGAAAKLAAAAGAVAIGIVAGGGDGGRAAPAAPRADRPAPRADSAPPALETALRTSPRDGQKVALKPQRQQAAAVNEGRSVTDEDLAGALSAELLEATADVESALPIGAAEMLVPELGTSDAEALLPLDADSVLEADEALP